MAPSAPLPLPLAQKPQAPLPLEPSLAAKPWRPGAIKGLVSRLYLRAAPLVARLPGMLMALLMALGLALAAEPAQAALNTNSYDGNIYALYAGNGSLVPPRNNLAQTLAAHRPAALIFYLDDDSASKQFAPVVSELQRLWGNNIELIPLVSDPLQNRPDAGSDDPAHYWKGLVPQVVVLGKAGEVLLDASGQVPLENINEAISNATGIALPEGLVQSSTQSFNELNSEVVSR